MTPHIRWMTRNDMPQILNIEAQSFAFPWREDEFLRVLRERTVIGMVATDDPEEKHVIAYMLYELENTRLHLLNFAVHQNHRRQGVGLAMVQKLISKLTHRRRKKIEALIWESNLHAQLFFKACGFRAVARQPEAYEETREDGYLFRFDACEQISQVELDRLFFGASEV